MFSCEYMFVIDGYSDGICSECLVQSKKTATKNITK